MLLWFVLALIIMLVGLAGVLLPVLPGIPLIFLAFLGYAVVTGFEEISQSAVALMAIITGLSLLIDWTAATLGVKKLGGSYRGMLGAFFGMVIGLVVGSLIGMLIGAFAGAVLFEYAGGASRRQSVRAGAGTFIGFLVGGLAKFVVSSVMIGFFIYLVLF